MVASGAVTLGELAGRLAMLEIACSRCERRGRLSVARLIEQHGADARLPDLRAVLAGNCPRVASVSINDRCGVHYPQLVAPVLSGSRTLSWSSVPTRQARTAPSARVHVGVTLPHLFGCIRVPSVVCTLLKNRPDLKT
jgi:hypothetical protein